MRGYCEPFVGGGALFFSLKGCKPFVKWVGGKRQLLAQMAPYIPEGPFDKYVLGDMNERLIRTYRGVRDDVEAVIQLLHSYPHDKTLFLDMRTRDIDAATDPEVAAWFIYLNRCGFNGLYRVNKSGRFNVPFDGISKNPTICDEETLRACSKALQGVELISGSFYDTVSRCTRGSFVYFDPPYVPLSMTSDFTSYTKDKFDIAQQKLLVSTAIHLKNQGVAVLLSNSSAPPVWELYKGFEIIPVAATRRVNSKASGRGLIAEVLIR